MCPILKENRNRYPANWSTEIVPRIRERSGGQCEKCGAINHSWVNRRTRELCLSDEDEAIRVVLTVAHLDHQPENCSDEFQKELQETRAPSAEMMAFPSRLIL